MGQQLSSYITGHAGCPGIMEGYFKNGKVCQLWSFMSATNDQYIWITDVPGDHGTENTYKIEATGKAEGKTLPLLKIKFILAKEIGDVEWFYMQFQKSNATYTVQASDKGVKGVQGSNEDSTTWLPQRMQSPNEPYWVLKSDQGSKREPLYLSSDGEGNMRLKRANTTKEDFLPPNYNPFIDPALLFRGIDPLL